MPTTPITADNFQASLDSMLAQQQAMTLATMKFETESEANKSVQSAARGLEG